MIESIRVQRYRSIVDTGDISLNADHTTLVGGNEAGKTNLLKSVDLLGDIGKIPRNDLCDYLPEDTVSSKLEEIPIIEVSFSSNSSVATSLMGSRRFQRVVQTIDGEEVERVVKMSRGRQMHFPPNEIDSSLVTVVRYADGTHYIQFEDSNLERDYLSHQISRRAQPLMRNLSAESIAEEINRKVRRIANHSHASAREYTDGERDGLIFSFQEYLSENDDIIKSQYVAKSETEMEAQDLLDENFEIIESYRNGEGIVMFGPEIQRLPDVQYFDDVEGIANEVPIKEIEENPDSYPAYSSILRFARLEPENLDSLSSGEIRDRRQNAGKEFSDLFNKYWSQSDIEIAIELSDQRVSIQFYDESNKRKSSSDRSKGLRRFVSFLTQVITRSESDLQDTIVLLDSPDVHLHPEGQKNLRDSLKTLSEDNQLIVATHAPYMIDTDDLTSIRVVERVNSEIGTLVSDIGREETASSDSLAPLRAALGATFSDSLFASSHSLLVEGYEDRIYLNSFSKYLSESNVGAGFDPRMQVVDCGGATKTSYMGRLVDAENYNYAVLLDDDEEGHRARDQLIESGIPSEQISYVSDYIETEGVATIEDLLPRDLLYNITSEIHDVSIESLREGEYNEKKGVVWNLNGQLKQINEISNGGMQLKKSSIAEYFSKGVLEGRYSPDDLGQECIDTFSNVIEDLNTTVVNNGSTTNHTTNSAPNDETATQGEEPQVVDSEQG